MKLKLKQDKGAFGLEVLKALAFGALILFIIAYIVVVLATNLSASAKDKRVELMGNRTILAVSGMTTNYSTWFQIGAIVVIVALFSVVLYYLNAEKGTGLGGA